MFMHDSRVVYQVSVCDTCLTMVRGGGRLLRLDTSTAERYSSHWMNVIVCFHAPTAHPMCCIWVAQQGMYSHNKSKVARMCCCAHPFPPSPHHTLSDGPHTRCHSRRHHKILLKLISSVTLRLPFLTRLTFQMDPTPPAVPLQQQMLMMTILKLIGHG